MTKEELEQLKTELDDSLEDIIADNHLSYLEVQYILTGLANDYAKYAVDAKNELR